MGHRFAELAFTPKVRALQEIQGSRGNYARMEQGEPFNDTLTEHEVQFIATRDSLYMASVSETGWPYVQHRGGPPGFVKVIDSTTIGFADFRGNRQYVSVGNLSGVDQVAMIFVDYPSRSRLKLLGHAQIVGPEQTELLARLKTPGYRAKVERGFLVRIAAFDWNCPQHITPRFTEAQVATAMAPLRARIEMLEQELAAARVSPTPPA
jgi:predicted pyridoxine 5'-phosphate oxidase superfamily flavin-nucleotide-binding protein